eukprot:Skav227041  [mRNA]  locus=scaffold72:374131:380220:+ [translate_table: standard]
MPVCDLLRKSKDGWSVSCRVGIAHGECIGGIVGTEMQRYHLFGELMSELEVLESTAPEGCVQVLLATAHRPSGSSMSGLVDGSLVVRCCWL